MPTEARLEGLAQNLVAPTFPRAGRGAVFRGTMLHQPVIPGAANRKMHRGGYCRCSGRPRAFLWQCNYSFRQSVGLSQSLAFQGNFCG